MAEGLRKIIIVDNDVTGIRYTSVWSDFVPYEIKSWGYDVSIIKGHPAPNWKEGYLNQFTTLSTLYNNIQYLLKSRLIPDDAIFIFPNARCPVVLQLNEYRTLHKLNWKFIGFWEESIYFTYMLFRSNMHYGKYKGDYDSTLMFERFLAKVYDYNLIPNEHQFNYFSRVLTTANVDVRICPTPFSSLYEYSKEQSQEKSDLIVCVTRPMSDHDLLLFNSLKKIFTDYSFVVAYEKNFNIVEYHRLLSKAKIVISHSAKEVNPFPIWESLLYGCIPLIPNTRINKMYFGDEFNFPRKLLIPPFLNYVQRRDLILDKIKGYMENYLDYTENLHILAKDVHSKYYNSNHLKILLQEIHEQDSK